ncbi:hypothetical protein E5E91_08675 [Deinococcus radiodurans R1 = ATCC 13939 = DSM 20539]|uniref:Uncharacterized protein n=2 Tax=Deinococcus radiodurans TaxID=1299 RepID=Q9RTS0_DEIRA|nr:hypothetical protein DR_1686 [Deinococcus radiodurans R1 = ATCC 13939 = DSM 20539]QEM71112.1 hypothetical protein DXG80_04590 [Deinococcus radiodurans]UDL00765.1 hypothetical protein E5E91_08675 [Deinococcus radiodurans R1 = ATCC 13939 = DSM 20539]HCE65801.1 hypothetical protein [Deinococcus radiodurans]
MMARFAYLTDDGKAKKSKKKKSAKKTPAPDGRGQNEERVEPVYVRKETVRAVWREVKKEGGESVSELVEDLLLQWLRERA